MRLEHTLFVPLLFSLLWLASSLSTVSPPKERHPWFGEECDMDSEVKCLPGLSCFKTHCYCQETEREVNEECARKLVQLKPSITTTNRFVLGFKILARNGSVTLNNTDVVNAEDCMGQPNVYTCRNLKSGTPYKVKATFINELSENKTEFQFQNETYTLPAQPANITHTNYHNGTLQVSWAQEGNMAGAECRLRGGVKWLATTNVTTICTWTFNNESDVEVDGVDIVVFNGAGDSNSSGHDFTFIYSYADIKNVIQTVNVTSVSPNSARLIIQEKKHAGDYIAVYLLRYNNTTCISVKRSDYCNMSDNCHQSKAEVNGTEVSFLIDNLQPGTPYDVTVTPLLCSGENATAKSVDPFRTPFTVKLEASSKNKTVTVMWETPMTLPNANYTVCLKDLLAPEQGSSSCPSSTVSAPRVLCDAHEIQAQGTNRTCEGEAELGFWEYDVILTADSSNVNISTASVTTGPSKPNMLTDVHVATWENFTSCGGQERADRSFLCVTWRELCPRERNGLIQSYELQGGSKVVQSELSVYNLTTAWQYRRDANTEEYSVLLPAKPGSTIDVRIRAVTTEGIKGDPYIQQVVIPDVPKAAVPDAKKVEELVPQEKVNTSQFTFQFQINNNSFLFEDEEGNPIKDRVVILTAGGGRPKDFDSTADYDKYPGWANRTEALKDGGYRINKDALDKLSGSPLTVTIGDEVNCSSSQNKYCDGHLDPGKTYSVWVSLCNEAHCVRVLLIANQTTVSTDTMEEEFEMWKLGLIVFGAICALIFVIVLICCTGFRDKIMMTQRTNLSEWTAELSTLRNRPVSRPMRLVSLETSIAKKQRDDFLLLRDEFEDLCLYTKTKKPPNNASLMDINLCKNRYADIMAYDHSRVRLAPDEEGSDYINANFVPGYNREDEYVACQGPLPYTVSDFWRMVWEHRMPIIVMLTLPKEFGKIKCEQYWPAERGEEVEYDNIRVKNTSVSNVNDYNITIFSISNILEEEEGEGKAEPFEVVHFHHLQWPDMTADLSPESMIQFLTVVRQHVRPDKPGPIVVHCSAGVGRTGTYICIDYVMQFINQRPVIDEIDIYGFILRMRQSRGKMVQTEEQYLFIHQCARYLMAARRKREEEVGASNGGSYLPRASPSASVDSAKGDSRCSLQNDDLQELAMEPADMDTVELDTTEGFPGGGQCSGAEDGGGGGGDVELSVYDTSISDDGPVAASSTENLCVP